jgi:hypothetical protein
MIKVRFNLGRGDNYRKWKIEFPDDRKPIFLDPWKTQLILKDAILRNRKKSAEKIHSGANKYVCAWVDCSDVLVGKFEVDEDSEVKYNPRVLPYWVEDGKDVDGKSYDTLITKENKIFRNLSTK